MQIIAFPFAGGNKYSYNHFFPINCNVTILEYSGRKSPNKEDLIENLDELISDLLLQFRSKVDYYDNYIIYGHSMGSLIGYLICKEVEKLGLKLPIKLVVSGAKSPKYSIEKILSNLPNKDFWDEVSKLGGISDELNEYPELIDYFISILKADFKCIENYQYDSDSSKLLIPIDVFYGSEDYITKEEVEAWKEVTTADINITKLKGNHFFIFDHVDYFKKYFESLTEK